MKTKKSELILDFLYAGWLLLLCVTIIFVPLYVIIHFIVKFW